MSLAQIIIIVVAAFLAGIVNAIAGGGTLITFPALIWIGLDPVVANVTSTVGIVPGTIGGVFGFRHEMSGIRRWLKWFILPSVIGGLIGALLLLLTPSKIFASIVPFLILFATALFSLQEPINRRLRRSIENSSSGVTPREATTKWLVGATALQFLVAIYGGYFGAGIGILMLAVLGLIGLTDIHQMNGLKNTMGFSINGIAAISFMVSGNVRWFAAAAMAVAALLGGYCGAKIARVLGRTFVRRFVIIVGLIMAISLFFNR
ncbi:MAG: sulfite exporter TauE/SafE family protein [Acidobacteriota bacterium]